MYLSDLRCLPDAERLRLARKLEKVCPKDASLHDWNDALQYPAGQPPQQMAQAARERLIQSLSRPQ